MDGRALAGLCQKQWVDGTAMRRCGIVGLEVDQNIHRGRPMEEMDGETGPGVLF